MLEEFYSIMKLELADITRERSLGPLSDASMKRLAEIGKLIKSLDLHVESKPESRDLSGVSDEELERV